MTIRYVKKQIAKEIKFISFLVTKLPLKERLKVAIKIIFKRYKESKK